MEDKLVTLAIHTYQKALMLKLYLENSGIEVYLHNVNLIQPVVSSGVRVRIKENDLPRALELIENSDFFKEMNSRPDEKTDEADTKKVILIPVDFSDYAIKACKLGFNYAKQNEAEVHLLHSYFSPFFPASIPFGDSFVYQPGNEESIKVLFNKVHDEMLKFKNLIADKISIGEWDDVKFTYSLREGLPEDEIIALSKEIKPIMIVMGTRGKDKKELDLLGSVAAEVIERSKYPVMAIPENTPFSSLNEIKRVAFGTSFEQRDLLAVDTLIKRMNLASIELYLFHISHKPDTWDEIKLGGIKEYFAKQYPELKIHYDIIDANNLVVNVDNFISKNRIDLISLATYRRNMLARIFNPSVAQRMLFHTDTPLLVLRG